MMKYNMLKLLTLLVSACIPVTMQAHAADSLRHGFGRLGVVSSTGVDTPFTDTLDTGKPGIRVVLYGDGTFRYVKDRVADAGGGVFAECWDTLAVNPYPDREPVPESFSLWIVDTLDAYCCPRLAAPSSRFGIRHGRRHQGVDLPCAEGAPVRAAFDGKVRVSSGMAGYGELVIVRHANGLETFYAHLSRRDVAPGDWVNAGDVVGLSSTAGRSTGPMLHFETRYRGRAFDPAWLIDFETGILRHRLLRVRSWYFDPGSRYVQSVDDEDEIFLAEERTRKDARNRVADESAVKRYYTVHPGDTLAKIARLNGTTVRAICELNGIRETTTLLVGRRLRIR